MASRSTASAASVTVGALAPRFPDVDRIVVLPGQGLGDLLFAMPAMQSLVDAYGASITLLGTPLQAALLDGRPSPVDEVEVLPVARGVHDVRGRDEDPVATARFVDRLAARHHDLAVQMHGGGRFSNPFVLRLGARHTIGTRTPDAAHLERTIPYVYYQHEVLRALEVVGLAGAAPTQLEPRLESTAAERAAARERRTAGRPLVLLHPGATDPRRQWPAERFAEVAAALARSGADILVVGAAEDVPAGDEIVGRAGDVLDPRTASQVRSLAGALDLSELTGVLAEADVLVGNDSGPRHMAQAVGTATVGLYLFGNVINAAPLSRTYHRVHAGQMTACPVCGRDVMTAPRCEHDDSLVADIAAAPVVEDVEDLLSRLAP
ncbi:hypothetical protein GCM10023169_26820 [Georgenia halophila]|uniref:ADP-heptose:LPS heptosyltransferase n=1 Tax=Georgenia halophila TaxID=620889 RepID=A0ABP8LD91_9MICO